MKITLGQHVTNALDALEINDNQNNVIMKELNKEKVERTIKNGEKAFVTLLVVVVLMILNVLLFSCTPSETTSDTSTNCDCGVVVQSMSYNIPDNNGGVIVQSTIIVRNNCTQLTKTVNGVSGVVVNGSQWCN